MFEKHIEKNLFTSMSERTLIDKLMAKEDIGRLKTLIRKRKLTRDELLEMLYLCTSTESKLLNLDAWGRYLLLKYFVWLREFIKIAELHYDYKEYLADTPNVAMTPRTKLLLEHCEQLLEHNAKFLIDLYLAIGRTTLSLGAMGFRELLTNKFEMAYTDPSRINTPHETRGIGKIFGMGKKGGSIET